MKTKALTYSEKLRDPRWQQMRLRIMERDKFTCKFCDSTEKTLNVHHRYYLPGKAPWEYDVDVLVTLCEECHELTEQSMRIIATCFESGQEMAAIVMTSLSLIGKTPHKGGKEFAWAATDLMRVVSEPEADESDLKESYAKAVYSAGFFLSGRLWKEKND